MEEKAIQIIDLINSRIEAGKNICQCHLDLINNYGNQEIDKTYIDKAYKGINEICEVVINTLFEVKAILLEYPFSSNEFDNNCVKFHLTVREKEIIRLVSSGTKNKEIASKLYISQKTIHKHLSNIFIKVGAKNRIELLNKLGLTVLSFTPQSV